MLVSQGLRAMLTILLIMAMFNQGLSVVSYGEEFITAFPENIAYYYPDDPENAVHITALYMDTSVKIICSGELIYMKTLSQAQTVTFNLPEDVEEHDFNLSPKSVRITSSKPIVVQSISKRGNSVQTNIVQPTENLAKLYSIPSLNYIDMNSTIYRTLGQSLQISKRFSSFRLVIINAKGQSNTVTIKEKPSGSSISGTGSQGQEIILEPYALVQLPTNGSEITILSSYEVAVLLTHPCVQTSACQCNMVVNQLNPSNQWGFQFLVPSVKDLSKPWLHVTSTTKIVVSHGIQNMDNFEPYSSKLLFFPYAQNGPQNITTSGVTSSRLISPGFIVELMPLSAFSACYLAHFSSSNGEVVIIAQTDYKDSVHIDRNLLSSAGWSIIADTKYSSVSVSLDGIHLIWHPTSQIGVYMFERMRNGILYGGPAIHLNDMPDPSGCVLTPSMLNVVHTFMTWPESHQSCMNITYQLYNPSTAEAQKVMVDILRKEGITEEFWIGLRRSLLTLDWYWQMGDDSMYDLSYTHWDTGEPGGPLTGMCASISLNSDMDFHWKSAPCCRKMKSICYKQAEYFSLYVLNSDYK